MVTVAKEPYRCKHAIKTQILKTALEEPRGISPTHIAWRCNLSFDQLTKYLNELVSKDLLAVKPEGMRRRYFLTPAGVRYIDAYAVMQKAEAGMGI